MVSTSDWGPRPLDRERANGARMYDYLLGGGHNFAVDRQAVKQLLAINPEAAQVARSNRQFVVRTVRFCLERGIDQFLDLGSGVPTAGNVHEIAQAAVPGARVLYVDNEPIAVAATHGLLRGNESADVLYADLRQPDVIFAAPETNRLLDFTRPLAVLMNAALHYVPDADGLPDILRVYRERVAPGSHFVFSHMGSSARNGVRAFEESDTPMTVRSYEELAALLHEFDLVPPGLVYVPAWRPVGGEIYGDAPERSKCYGAVAVTAAD
jgi:S-adenosyl methyltransferase